MQGAGLRRQRIERCGIDGQSCHLRDGTTQAVRHAIRGAAGGRGQRDAWRWAIRMQRLRDAQHQQARDRGGLAGAGATGDQQQGAAQGERGGMGLVVAIACVRKQ